MNIYEQALTNQNPEPTDSPAYIPWWAKGEFARQNGTKWSFPDGTTVRGGQIVQKGHGRRVEVQELSKYRPDAQKRSEVPSVAPAIPRKIPKTPDRAQELWSGCKGMCDRMVLLKDHGIDPKILLDAPNPGVASMRGLNALRRVLK